MLLLTWHGTIVCLSNDEDALVHARLADHASPLEIHRGHGSEWCLSHPQPGLQVAALPGGGVSLARGDRFLSAGPDSRALACDRDGVGGWETFLPLEAADLAALVHIVAHRWIVRDSRAVIPRRAIGLRDGFILQVGDGRVDLHQGLAGVLKDGSVAPSAIHLPQDGGGTLELVIARPDGSALLALTAWPVRARRTAEMIALAAHRQVMGREPHPDAIERDSADLLSQGGAAGLEDLLERLVAEAAPVPTQDGFDTQWAAAAAHAKDARSGLALAAFRRIAVDHPADARAWFEVGRLSHQAGAYAAARAAWERCVAVDPLHVEAVGRLAAMAGSLGRPLEAVALFEAAFAKAPGWVELQVLLAGRYAELNWLDRADAVFAQIGEALMGWMEGSRRQVRRRLERAREALAATNPPAGQSIGQLPVHKLVTRAQNSFMLGEFGICEDAIRTLLKQAPAQLEPHLLRTELRARRSGAEAALGYLQKQQGAFAEMAEYRLAMARWLLATGRNKQAQARLEPLIRAQPRNDAYELMARSALGRNDPAALARISEAWLAFNRVETGPAIYGIAAARAAGRLARLDDIPTGGPVPCPRIVQFWDSPVPPPDVATTMQSWRRRHPEMEYALFDTSAARAFLDTHCAPEVLAVFDAAHHPAMQSDILRLGYLSVHGGIYVDADDESTRDMRRVFSALSQVDLVAVQSTETPPYVFNGFICARPGCAIVVDALAEAARLVAGHVARGTRPDIWNLTGPGLLTRAISRFLAEDANAGRVLLLTDTEYAAFARTRDDLGYKRTALGDWRLV